MFLEQQNYNDFWRIMWCKEDWNNEAENSALHHRNNFHFEICSNRKQYILVYHNILFLQYFDDMNAALVSIRDSALSPRVPHQSLTRLPRYTTLTKKHKYRFANCDCMCTIYISKIHMDDGNMREWNDWICFWACFVFFSLQVHYLSLSISISLSLIHTHTHTHTNPTSMKEKVSGVHGGANIARFTSFV